MIRSSDSESGGFQAAALCEESVNEQPAAVTPRVPRPALSARYGGGHVLLLLAIMALVAGAPLLHPGLPATRAGLLPIAWFAREPVPPSLGPRGGEVLLVAIGQALAPFLTSAGAWKLILAAVLVVGSAGMWLAGRRLGGQPGGLISVSVYLFSLPLAAALYIEGSPGGAWAWAVWPWAFAVALGTGRHARRGAVAGVVLGGLAVWTGGLGTSEQLAPADFLAPHRPEAPTVEAWLAGSTYALGVTPLVLALFAAWSATTAKVAGGIRRACWTLGLVALSLLLSLAIPGLPGLETRLLLAFATLTLLGAILPRLIPEFMHVPWLAGLITVVALLGYEALQPAFYPMPPEDAPLAFLGPDRFLLAEARVDGVLAPGETVRVTTGWQLVGSSEADYSSFVHITDLESGALIAQQDALLVSGERPTSHWVQGELVHGQYEIAIPADAPPGPYRIFTGLYEVGTGLRLPRWPEGDSIEVPS